MNKVKFSFKWENNNAFCDIVYENGIVTAIDDCGISVSFKLPKEDYKNKSEESAKQSIALNVGARMAKVDAIRLLHNDLAKLNVTDYCIGKHFTYITILE